MTPANNAPVYASMYKELAEIAREHGYALAIHGSLSRDFDLVCVPWANAVNSPERVVKDITATFGFREIGTPEIKEHSRVVYTIGSQWGDCFLDISFTPSSQSKAAKEST